MAYSGSPVTGSFDPTGVMRNLTPGVLKFRSALVSIVGSVGLKDVEVAKEYVPSPLSIA